MLTLSLGSTTEMVLVTLGICRHKDDVGAGDLHRAALLAADDGVGHQRVELFRLLRQQLGQSQLVENRFVVLSSPFVAQARCELGLDRDVPRRPVAEIGDGHVELNRLVP